MKFLLLLACAIVVALPATAFGQTTTGPTPAPTTAATPMPTTAATPAPTSPAATAQPTIAATPVPATALTVSNSKAAPGTDLHVNGSGFQAGETVDLSFNGTAFDPLPNAGVDGTFSVAWTAPSNRVAHYCLSPNA